MLRRSLAGGCALGFLMLLPQPAKAQEGVLLRYRPAVGARLATGTDFDFAITYVGFPSIPDSATAGAQLRLFVSERVQGMSGSRYVVRFTSDSARAFLRRTDGSRRDLATPQFANVSVMTLLDERLNRMPLDSAANDSVRALQVRGRRTGFEIPLPDGPVTTGVTWASESPFVLEDMVAGGELRGVYPLPLMARVTARVDSLTPRGSDTLAFVSTTATFDPTTSTAMQGENSVTLTITGAMATSQIWSSAWNGWVSGVLRARVELRATAADSTMPAPSVVTVIDGRMMVRR